MKHFKITEFYFYLNYFEALFENNRQERIVA